MKDELFNELLESVQEAGCIMRGEHSATQTFEFDEPDVKTIRNQTGVSQSKFASLIGVSVKTVQNWEDGYRHPRGSAKVLLKLLKANPKYVFKELQQNQA